MHRNSNARAVHPAASGSARSGRLISMLFAAIAACIAALALVGSPAMAGDVSRASSDVDTELCVPIEQVKGAPDEETQTCTISAEGLPQGIDLTAGRHGGIRVSCTSNPRTCTYEFLGYAMTCVHYPIATHCTAWYALGYRVEADPDPAAIAEAGRNR